MGNEYLLNSKIKLGCVSGWKLAPLKEKGVMNGLVHANDGDLGKVIAYTLKVFELCRVTYACGLMLMCMEFRDEILLR